MYGSQPLIFGISNVCQSTCVWPTALKLGCITNFDTLFLVMGLISLVGEIQFMLISNRHICIRFATFNFWHRTTQRLTLPQDRNISSIARSRSRSENILRMNTSNRCPFDYKLTENRHIGLLWVDLPPYNPASVLTITFPSYLFERWHIKAPKSPVHPPISSH